MLNIANPIVPGLHSVLMILATTYNGLLDTMAIAIAGIGIFLSNQTRNTIYDSISSLSIGAILMAFAFFLARENKGLLIGEAISRQDYKRIVRLIKEIPEVNKIITIRTMHLAPKDVLVTIEVNLINGLAQDR